jgi:cardiolipin synthase A/B
VKLISPKQYVTQAAEAMRLATKRIYLISMVIADHDNTHELIEELEAAAKRGVEVVVAADVFTFGEVSGGFLPVRYYSPGARDANRMVRELKKSGVRFSWLGRARMTLFNGRTHSKWCVVDDTVFSFGGVNMYGEGIDNIDYMFRLDDEKLADRLVDEQKRIQTAERRAANYSSVAYEYNDATVLFDGGIIGQSVIYRRAVELSEKAKHITFVSQYCPTGRLSRILKKKRATLYFNRPQQAEGLNRIVLRVALFLTRLKSVYKRAIYLHAKFIIFTMDDGSKVAITGSHNFAYTGVLLGTREIAIETKDPEIIKQLETFIKKEVIV